MHDYGELILTVVASVLASSGFWALIQNRINKKSNQTKLLIGLAHDRIITLGTEYLNRETKTITVEEYRNLHDYLYIPYEKNGGNGVAKKIMKEVTEQLEIK